METHYDCSTLEYNKEYLSNLNIPAQNIFIKYFVNKVVDNLNNPSLIKLDQQPNENIIYHLYSDGTITRQKGSWAYGNRTIYDIAYEIVKPNTFFTFPNKGEKDGDTYAIMTIDDCYKVRKLINEIFLNIQ